MSTSNPIQISENCWKHINEYGDVFYTQTSDVGSEEHRENGPAVEWSNGDKEWWINGFLHRTSGPAIEYVDGYKEWWFDGKQIAVSSQEDFEKFLKKYFPGTFATNKK